MKLKNYVVLCMRKILSRNQVGASFEFKGTIHELVSGDGSHSKTKESCDLLVYLSMRE